VSDHECGRATSPVVGVAVMVGVTVALVAVVGAVVAFGTATSGAAPAVQVEVGLNASDGYPGGQRLRITHRAGDPLSIADLAVVLTVERVGVHARLTAFPTRRLTDANVRGDRVFDNSYAGVDGELDAAHTDGTWASGERTSVRVAQDDLVLRPGESVHVRLVHRPTDAVIARETANAPSS